jgi:elongation factor G
MKDYNSDKIRNICLMSHGGAGKTTLAEAILYNTEILERCGKVNDGNTTTDYDPEEIRRKISINTAIAPCEWKDHKLNIVDTPGYFDFVGEVIQGIRISDAAVILVSAKGGVEVGTEKSWDYAVERDIPRMFFVNKMDEDNADFDKTYDKLKELYGNSIIIYQLPIIQGEKFIGIVDIVHMKARKFENGGFVEIEIPESMAERVNEVREALKEAVAETDEELLEKFFDGGEFTSEEIKKGLSLGIKDGSISPVLCGSALNNAGVKLLMDALVEYLPSPEAAGTVKVQKNNDVIELKTVPDEKLSALVFKTIADPFVGKITMFKVYTGTLNSNSVLLNTKTGKTEKLAQLFIMRGKKQLPVEKLIAGDIGAVAKLQGTNTGDTLCDQSNPVIIEGIEFPEPMLSLAIEPKAKGDEEKIGQGLQKLQDEDPTFKVEINNETHQTLISGVGEQHLDVIVSKLKAKFGVSVNLIDPKIPYRETIRKHVKVEGKHKKQTGGHGQYGHVWIEFEPGEQEDLQFEEKIFGGAVPRQYFPAVEKGLRESMQHGVLAGYPVVNLKALLVDGSFHPVDSSEMAFKLAASLAYRKGLKEASPVLLEPIAKVDVFVPDNYMGDIIGDLNKRRGRIMGMNPVEGGLQQISAEVPMAEMFKYATDLRSMTQSRGYFKMEFSRYEETPVNIAEKVIETAKKEMQEE